MMHWKTLQTTIGAFALGICLTTVISPSQAAPFSASQEILKSAPTKIFQPLEDKTVGKIYGKNVSISDKEYLGVLQDYIDAKELKRGNTNNNKGKGTLEKILEAIHAHDDIKLQLKTFIPQAYQILGLDKQDNPLGAKTEEKKKTLIEQLGQGNLKHKAEYEKKEQLDEFFSQQLEKLSNLWGSPQSKNLENPLLVNMMAMKLIDILTEYPGQKIDNLILKHKDRYPFFICDFIDQSLLKAFDDDDDKKKDKISEYNRIIKSFQSDDLTYFAQKKASVITEHMSNQFQGEFKKKLEHWPKTLSFASSELIKAAEKKDEAVRKFKELTDKKTQITTSETPIERAQEILNEFSNRTGRARLIELVAAAYITLKSEEASQHFDDAKKKLEPKLEKALLSDPTAFQAAKTFIESPLTQNTFQTFHTAVVKSLEGADTNFQQNTKDKLLSLK